MSTNADNLALLRAGALRAAAPSLLGILPGLLLPRLPAPEAMLV